MYLISSVPFLRPVHKVEWFQHNMRRAVAKGVLVLVDNPPPAVYRETVGGKGRSSDITAQAFQAVTLMSLTHSGSMQREAGPLAQ